LIFKDLASSARFDSAPGHQEFSQHWKWSIESLVLAAVWAPFPKIFRISL
jgi:hypothetical protein